MFLSSTEQWEALQLTKDTLVLPHPDLNRPLPARLTDVLLPKAGVSIEYVSFEASTVIPDTRTCTVFYVQGSPKVMARIRKLKTTIELPDHQRVQLESLMNKYPRRMGTLESVVWNAVLYNNEDVVPANVNLCNCTTPLQFQQYFYVALGYCKDQLIDPDNTRHVDGISSFETIHRSWSEYNFAKWDTGSDLTSRYAALRSLVPLPPNVAESHSAVVTIRERPDDQQPLPAAGAGAPAPAPTKDQIEKRNAAIKKAFEASYRGNCATNLTSTWGLGAIAFFGACRGDRWVWAKAFNEAKMWFQYRCYDERGENDSAKLAMQSFEESHFPEAVYAISRAMFGGNVLALQKFRANAKTVVCPIKQREVVNVKVNLEDGEAMPDNN